MNENKEEFYKKEFLELFTKWEKVKSILKAKIKVNDELFRTSSPDSDLSERASMLCTIYERMLREMEESDVLESSYKIWVLKE